MSAVGDGVRAGRRSLSPSRAEKVDFVLYKGPPPLSPLVPAEELATVEEEWMMRANYIVDDLHWLLRLPHDRFTVYRKFSKLSNKIKNKIIIQSVYFSSTLINFYSASS